MLALVSLDCSTLEPVPHQSPSFLSISLLLFYFLCNFYLGDYSLELVLNGGQFSASINFLLILPFMPCLNSSISGHLSYPLSLATLLKSYTNSSIVLPPCLIFFSSAIFTDSSSPPPNSLLISAKNSPAVSNSISPVSIFSITFSFQISAGPPYTQERTHWICSSTSTSLNLILMYNLYTPTNLETFDGVLSKVCGFATSVTADALSPLSAAPPTCAVNTAIYSCSCRIMAGQSD